jgi:hypothetical protein
LKLFCREEEYKGRFKDFDEGVDRQNGRVIR